MNFNLLNCDKDKIKKINDLLTKKYPCLRMVRYYCKYTKSDLLKDNNVVFNEEIIDKNKILLAYEYIFDSLNSYCDKISFNRGECYRYDFFETLLVKNILIALQQLLGSLMCNYYKNSFCLHGNGFEDKVGYAIFNPYEFGEEKEINYIHPLSKFNEDIENLEEKLKNKIGIKKLRNEKWANDVDDIKHNLFELIKPISFKNQEWVLLAADVRFDSEDNKNIWNDAYLIKTMYKSDMGLTEINDRELTIESKDYTSNIADYINEKSSSCMLIKPIKYEIEAFNENDLMIPPSMLIEELNLKYNSTDSTWRDTQNNIIIYTSNNDKKMYKDTVSKSIFINKKTFDLIKDNIKFFSFTSRSFNNVIAELSEFHMEFDYSKEIKSVNNLLQRDEENLRCKECKYNKIETPEEVENERIKFEKIIMDNNYINSHS